jgi:hypothetical protein
MAESPFNSSPAPISKDTKTPHKSASPETLSEPRYSTFLPTYFFAYDYRTNNLHRANLLTGEQTFHKIPCFNFTIDCRWSEMPGKSLVITGGYPWIREVVKIDICRESAVCSQPPMHTGRCRHVAVYHSQYLYVLGGFSGRYLRECERYGCVERRWELLPAMPEACSAMTAVELDDSLYILGGYNRSLSDTVQKLSWDSLTWELMELKLPQVAGWFPCFKIDTQVYLLIKETLYSFTPISVKPIKTLTNTAFECYSSYYSRGTLYFAWRGAIESRELEGLTSLA